MVGSRETAATEDLLALARGGDRNAEELLFEKLDARILALAQKRIWDREVARDLAQETLRTAFEKYREAPMPRGLFAWLFTIFHHKVGNYLKHRRSEAGRRVPFELLWGLSDPAATDAMTVVPLLQVIESGLRHASPECRRIFRLLLAGSERRELCAAFPGEPIGTIDSRISRCRAKLLSYFETSRKAGKP